MRRGYLIAIGLMFLAAVGCNMATSTAPSTNPNKPNAERKLTMTVASQQKVTQDRTDEILVTILRSKFEGPVSVEFRNLPPGVEMVTKDMTIPADKSTLTATIKATPTAALAEGHVVTVAAKAKDQQDMPEVTTTFKLDVKPK